MAVAPSDPSNTMHYFRVHVWVRRRVITMTTDGAVEHIATLSQKHLGKPYPWREDCQQVRIILVIEPEKITGLGEQE